MYMGCGSGGQVIAGSSLTSTAPSLRLQLHTGHICSANASIAGWWLSFISLSSSVTVKCIIIRPHPGTLRSLFWQLQHRVYLAPDPPSSSSWQGQPISKCGYTLFLFDCTEKKYWGSLAALIISILNVFCSIKLMMQLWQPPTLRISLWN